jgi:hypothetical protein
MRGDDGSDTSDLSIMSDRDLEELGRELRQGLEQELEQDLEPEEIWPYDFHYSTGGDQQEGDDGSQPLSNDHDDLPNEYLAAIVQSEENNNDQGSVAGGVVFDPVVAKSGRNHRKWVEMSGLTWSDKKRVTFADGGPSDNDKSELEGDPTEGTENEDVRSDFDGEADTSQGNGSDGGNETGEDEDDDEFNEPNLGGRKEPVIASLKTQTTPPATASPSASTPAVSPQRRSTRILARQEAEVKAQISNEDSVPSDAGFIPEVLDNHSVPKAARSECQFTVKYKQTKTAPGKE